MEASLPTPRYRSLAAVRQALAEGGLTVEGLVRHYLDRIAADNDRLNVFIEVFADEALAQARALDDRIGREGLEAVGRLCGMVLGIKDVLCLKDHQVTGASRILEGFQSLYTATALERLLAEDAIIIGRVNCDEFAMGSSTENSHYGPTRNAADPERVPGGSSGGSAVAVQADMCLASIGSDTGGSVRQPAAFCGVTGFKPTYGRISRHGLLAYASSFDQIGTLTHSVSDAALLLEVMAGPDAYDATCSPRPVPPFGESLKEKAPPARIAWFPEALDHPGLDARIRRQTIDYLERLRGEGYQLEPVSFDLLDYVVPAYYVLTTAEASSNLSRYDGVRFGWRHPEARTVEEVYTLTRTEGFGAEVKRRIMLGAFVLSAGYYDAYFGRAQKVRRLIVERLQALFRDFDFVAMPASPVLPWRLGELQDDPVSMYLADIYTVLANLAGLPAIALPMGQVEGLPVGIQFMAAPFREMELLRFAGSLRPLVME